MAIDGRVYDGYTVTGLVIYPPVFKPNDGIPSMSLLMISNEYLN